MSVATSTAIAIASGVGVAGSIAGSVIGAGAASDAANAQAGAANNAADLQYKLGEQGLNFQEGQYMNNQANIAPYLQSGYGGLANLDYLLGIPADGISATGGSSPQARPNIPANRGNTLAPGGGSPAGWGGGMSGPFSGDTPGTRMARGGFVPADSPSGRPITGGPTNPAPGPSAGTPAGQLPVNLSSLVNPKLGGFGSLSQGWQGGPFVAPTLQQAEENPGYKFQLQQGEQALQSSAAAQGGLVSAGEGKALTEFGQGLAQTDYQNVFNNSLTQYQQAYNQFEQQQADKYNRLAALSGTGQVAAGELSSAGNQTGSNIASLLLGTGNNVGQSMQNAGAATASGYVGGANAINGGLAGVSNSLSLLSLLGKFGGTGNNGGGGNNQIV